MKKAVFFDRDGVINIDTGYVYKAQEFIFIDKVIESLAYLKSKGYLCILVTNQSGIARGYYTEEDFKKLCDYMQSTLAEHQACFDAVYYCPHHIDGTVLQYKIDCNCRKPKSQMFEKAILEHDIDVTQSIMIGDHASDLQAAAKVNIANLILVGSHLKEQKALLGELSERVTCYKTVSDFVKNFTKWS